MQPRRPIPQLSRINAIRFDGKSIYHGLTVKAERRLRNNYAYRISYTLSQSKDDASSPGATESETNVPQDVRNIFDEPGEWARSSFDHRHQFIASGVYQVPFFADAGGVVGAVLGGWRANAILTLLSGAPFTVNLARGSRQHRRRARRSVPISFAIRSCPATSGRRSAGSTPSAFALPAPFTFGTRAAQQRDRPRMGERRCRAGEDLALGRHDRARVPLGDRSTC